ncbi:MAG: ImmA/IrrE family metallo-endopeptidase [Clostridiales bacterium]|jgi:Zn-dependent peptidase ImmA (M78 family)|nr:ImmA/IrrE family metallo-endopeptidase [Clostridiales bacterium]
MNRAKFLNRAGLYDMVSGKAAALGLNMAAPNYRIDAMQLAMQVCLNLKIEMLNFKETKICGILYKGENSTTIGLNARRSLFGQNFDCMHELIHYWFHDRRHFWCTPYDDSLSHKNFEAHLEWQANEGAAQFLMPYQSFIPNYSDFHDHFYARLSPENAQNAIIDHLAKSYLVGQKAVEYRINGLEKEITQFVKGIQIPQIKIISRHK